MAKKRLYVAYGSNLNVYQMKYRCPTAKLVGTGVVKDYELQFKGRKDSAFATIAPSEGSTVPVAVWELQPRDEKALDRYEGFPNYYFKQDIPVEMKNGETVNGMVYIMDLRQDFGIPSPGYVQTVSEGYHNCRLDTAVLKNAIRQSVSRYADSVSDKLVSSIDHQHRQMSLFDFDTEDVDIDEDNSESENDDYDPFEEDDGEESDEDEDEDESSSFIPTQ